MQTKIRSSSFQREHKTGQTQRIKNQNVIHCSTTLEASRQWNKAFKHSEERKLLNEIMVWKYFF